MAKFNDYDGISYQTVIFRHLDRMSINLSKSYTADPVSNNLMIDNYREMLLFLESLLAPYLLADDQEVVDKIQRYREIREKPFHDQKYVRLLREFFSFLVEVMHKNGLLVPEKEQSTLEDLENASAEIFTEDS